MKRTTQELKRPYRGDYRLFNAGCDGTYWEAPDGRTVRLAAAESEPPAARESVRSLLRALVASGVSER